MIKSVQKDHDKTPAIEYPCIQISSHSGQIVLFDEPKKGVALTCAFHNAGHYNEAWEMDSFSSYHGTIELSNEEAEAHPS